MRKILILIFVSVVIISTTFIFLHKKDNKLSTTKLDRLTNAVEKEKNQSTDEEEKIVEKEDEKIDDKQKEESKQNSAESNSNNNSSQAVVTEEKSSNNTAKSSSSNSPATKSQNNSSNSNSVTNSQDKNTQSSSNDGNLVNKNTIDYSFHKGRTEKSCNSNTSCTNQAIAFYIKNKKVIDYYSVLDVTANNGNVLGYFIEYVFKEGEYETDNECNSIGSSIKSELSDRVIGYRCSNRNGKYYLSITTDYD